MVKWTKGHFETVAKILGEAYKEGIDIFPMAREFVRIFSESNSHFDSEKFWDAIGKDAGYHGT